jgi:hypothetical protein
MHREFVMRDPCHNLFGAKMVFPTDYYLIRTIAIDENQTEI